MKFKILLTQYNFKFISFIDIIGIDKKSGLYFRLEMILKFQIF